MWSCAIAAVAWASCTKRLRAESLAARLGFVALSATGPACRFQERIFGLERAERVGTAGTLLQVRRQPFDLVEGQFASKQALVVVNNRTHGGGHGGLLGNAQSAKRGIVVTVSRVPGGR